MDLNRTKKIDTALRRLLDVALLEIPNFEQSETFDICSKALAIKKQTNLNYQGRLEDLRTEIVSILCSISELPEEWLPHTVFVEEEGVDNSGHDTPVFNEYKLTKIQSDGECILLNVITNEEEERHLSEIEIDWLITVLNRCRELGGKIDYQSIETPDKELYAFAYRIDLDRSLADEDIIKSWESSSGNDNDTTRYTPDEFACLVNDDEFCSAEFWVRFIKM